MEIRIPEMNKRKGVIYAVNDEGIELPIVDITHPAFACDASQTKLEIVAERSIQGLQKSAALPEDTVRAMANNSILMRKTMEAAGSPMDGMTTYLLKLGPENLGAGYASDMDRQMAAGISPLAIRIRLRQVACLLAHSLTQALARDKCRPLHLLNLASGPGIDSLNVLIMIRKENPNWLADRPIFIHAYDIEPSGPGFGARALAALRADGAPLSGLDVSFVPAKYNWADGPNWLTLMSDLAPEQSVLGVSSEGGLLEYGSDQEIQANLQCLYHIPGDFPLVGSLVRDENLPLTINKFGKLPLHPFDLDTFADLIHPAGWHIKKSVSGNPIYHVVRLEKNLDPPIHSPVNISQ